MTTTELQFEQQGFCIVRKLFKQEFIDEIKLNINRVVLEYNNKDKGSFINFTSDENPKVNSIHRLQGLGDNFFDELGKNDVILKLAQNLLKDDPVLFSMQAFLKAANTGLATPAHQDNAYWKHSGNGGLTIWLALGKCGRFNGMMEYVVNGPNKIVKHIKSTNTPGTSLIISEEELLGYNWKMPNLEKGDATIHNGHVIHRSGPNVSNFPREGFLLNFRGKNTIKDMKAFEQYLSELEMMHGRN